MVMDLYSSFGIALLGLVAVWYFHTRLKAHVAAPSRVTVARVVPVVLGIVLGYVMAVGGDQGFADRGTIHVLFDFLGWFGLVHLLPAMLVFVKDESQAYRNKMSGRSPAA